MAPTDEDFGKDFCAGWEEEDIVWERHKPIRGGGGKEKTNEKYVYISKSRKDISLANSPFTNGDRVDMYMSGNGGGRGVKVGIAKRPDGHYVLHAAKEGLDHYLKVGCSVFLRDLGTPSSGRYEFLNAAIYGAPAITFTVFPELSRLKCE